MGFGVQVRRGAHTGTTDDDLARRAREGSAPAFEDLVRRLSPPLYRFLLAKGVPAADVEDLVQETFARAYRALGRYDGRCGFSAWLFAIGRRCAVSHHRARRRPVPLEEMEHAVAAPAGPDPGETEPGGVWHTAAGLLSQREYQALWLRYGEDMPVADIARAMGISRLYVRVTLHRARSRLAVALAPAPEAEPALDVKGAR